MAGSSRFATAPEEIAICQAGDSTELAEVSLPHEVVKRALKKLRGSIIERTFADAKGHRGLRQLHGRGRCRALADIGLMVLGMNLLDVVKLRKTARNTQPDTS